MEFSDYRLKQWIYLYEHGWDRDGYTWSHPDYKDPMDLASAIKIQEEINANQKD